VLFSLDVSVQLPFQKVKQKETIKLEDMDPLRIKEETKNYTVEKMGASYNEICKGVMDNDPAYLW
jgi:hypothetical protein